MSTSDPESHPPPGTIRIVSFDVDGTLYDTRLHRLRVGLRLFRHRRILGAWTRTVEEARSWPENGMLDAAIRARTAGVAGVDAETVDQVLRHCLDGIWIQGLDAGCRRRGVAEALALLDERAIPRIIASDHPAEAKLEALGLSEGWRRVWDATSLGLLKPNPRMLESICEDLGCAPSELLHIGDRDDTDGEAARRAGAWFLSFPPERPMLRQRLARMLWG